MQGIYELLNRLINPPRIGPGTFNVQRFVYKSLISKSTTIDSYMKKHSRSKGYANHGNGRGK